MILHLLDRLENEASQPFMPNRAVVALDIGILLRLALLDMGDGDLQIDAQVFFYEFVGLLQEIMPELQLADITLEGFKLSLEFLTFWHFGIGFAAFHGLT